MNREIFPGGLYPLQGDVVSQPGNATATVTGLQNVPVADSLLNGGEVLTYSADQHSWIPLLLALATANSPGIVQPDDTTLTIDSNGIMSVVPPKNGSGGSQGFTQSFASNGWVQFPNGLIVQWMSGTQDNTSQTVTQSGSWPEPFPNNIFATYVTTNYYESDTTDSDICIYQVLEQSTTGWTLRRARGGQYAALIATSPTLIAIGN